MIGDRKKPFGSSGILAALLIAGREFLYAVCGSEPCAMATDGKGRELYYTYEGEECPHCGVVVTNWITGNLPKEQKVEPQRNERRLSSRRHSSRRHGRASAHDNRGSGRVGAAG